MGIWLRRCRVGQTQGMIEQLSAGEGSHLITLIGAVAAYGLVSYCNCPIDKVDPAGMRCRGRQFGKDLREAIGSLRGERS
jgi:hypothetical protein